MEHNMNKVVTKELSGRKNLRGHGMTLNRVTCVVIVFMST